MDFDDFLSGLKTIFFIFMWLFIIILLIAGSAITIQQIHFTVNKNLDTSTGKVHCDGDNVYTGRLYRVQYSLETGNLQSPQYYVRILNKDLYMKKEAEYFCRDFYVTKVSE